MTSDAYFMTLAIAQAQAAEHKGEVPVGALLVKDGEVVASAGNAMIGLHDPTAHAEVQVLRSAGQLLRNYRLSDCELYVTLEPCAMCAAATIHARIKRVVFGATDPKTGAAGSLLNVFDTAFNHQTKVTGGVLAAECGDLLKDFFKTKRLLAKA